MATFHVNSSSIPADNPDDLEQLNGQARMVFRSRNGLNSVAPVGLHPLGGGQLPAVYQNYMADYGVTADHSSPSQVVSKVGSKVFADYHDNGDRGFSSGQVTEIPGTTSKFRRFCVVLSIIGFITVASIVCAGTAFYYLRLDRSTDMFIAEFDLYESPFKLDLNVPTTDQFKDLQSKVCDMCSAQLNDVMKTCQVDAFLESPGTGTTLANVRLTLRRRKLDALRPFGNSFVWKRLRETREGLSSKLKSLHRAPIDLYFIIDVRVPIVDADLSTKNSDFYKAESYTCDSISGKLKDTIEVDACFVESFKNEVAFYSAVVKIRVDHHTIRQRARKYYALVAGKFGADNLGDYISRGAHRSKHRSLEGFFGTSDVKVAVVNFDKFSYTKYEQILGF